MISLQGKVALVTGGSRGIGAETAVLLAQAGADVALTYLSAHKQAVETAHRIAGFGQIGLVLKGDVSQEKVVRMIVAATVKAFGHVDILVNNAGIWKFGELGKMSARQWDETMDVNLRSTFLLTNALVPMMKKRKQGKIINIASTAGQRGEPYHSHYAASKAGMIGFTKAAAAELAPFGIMVNCVAPGWVDTDMSADPLRISSKKKKIVSLIPNGRVATSGDIANAVLFLASDRSDHLIGSTISINGGSVLA